MIRSRLRPPNAGRGRPLRAGAVIMAGWIAARVLLWESPFVPAVAVLPVSARMMAAPHQFGTTGPHAEPAIAAPRWPAAPRLTPPRPAAAKVGPIAAPGRAASALAASGGNVEPASEREEGSGFTPPPLLQAPAETDGSRWSGDAWLLWREGLGPVRATNGFVAPAYGARQVGAVLRFRLIPSSPAQPSLYLRASKALERSRDEELAAGFSLRPLRELPLTLGAELRATRVPGGPFTLRPAALAVTQLPPLQLPLRSEAEAYVQGGYVGGPYATPFVDGQLRVTRKLARLGGMNLTAGAGAWGGAQNGAARLDFGPTAALGLRLGPAGTRLSADWRFRVAGDAIPASGPALTLSAGF